MEATKRPSLTWRADNRWDWAQEDVWDKVQKDGAVKVLAAELIDLYDIYKATDFETEESKLATAALIDERAMALCLVQDAYLAELTDGESTSV